MSEVDLVAECSLDVKGGFKRLSSHGRGRIFDPQKNLTGQASFTRGHEIFSLCSRGILIGRRLNVRSVKVVPY